MVIVDSSNSRRFNVSLPCQAKGIIHHHARPLLLYPPMSYSQASEIVLLMVWQRLCCWLGPPLVVTRWRNFTHSWRSWQFHSWSRWGLHCFPLFSKRSICIKNYCYSGMKCAAWLIFQINNSSVSILIFVEVNASFMSVVQAVCLYVGSNTIIEWVFMSHPRNILWSASCTSPASLLK